MSVPVLDIDDCILSICIYKYTTTVSCSGLCRGVFLEYFIYVCGKECVVPSQHGCSRQAY